MKILPLTQLRVEGFPQDEQKWLPLLFAPLNQFLTSVTTALQQNLDFNSNFLGQEQVMSFTWTGTASLPLKFKLTMTGMPNALEIVQATENKAPVILLAAWQNTNGYVSLTDIAKVQNGAVSALVVGAAYTARVRVQT